MHRQLTPRTKADQGFTLLELVVAVFVLALGTIAVLGVINQARRGIGEEHLRFLAETVAVNRAQQIRFYGPGAALPARVQQGGYDWQVETKATPTRAGLVELVITVHGAGLPGARLVAFARPAGAAR